MFSHKAHDHRLEVYYRFRRMCKALGLNQADVLHRILIRWIDNQKETLLWKLVIEERKVKDSMPPKKKIQAPNKEEQEAADIDLGDEPIQIGGDEISLDGDDDDIVIDDIDLDTLEAAVTTEALEQAYKTSPKPVGGVSAEEINVLSKRIQELSVQLSTVSDILTQEMGKMHTTLRDRMDAQHFEMMELVKMRTRPSERETAPAEKAEEKPKKEKADKAAKNGNAVLSPEHIDALNSLIGRINKPYPIDKVVDAFSQKVAGVAKDDIREFLYNAGKIGPDQNFVLS